MQRNELTRRASSLLMVRFVKRTPAKSKRGEVFFFFFHNIHRQLRAPNKPENHEKKTAL